jgi:hypothetical protein
MKKNKYFDTFAAKLFSFGQSENMKERKKNKSFESGF